MKTLILLCALLTVTSLRTYTKCELARTLRDNGLHGYRGYSLAALVCVVKHESRYCTNAIRHNRKAGRIVSSDYGLFQLNSQWWCTDGINSSSLNICKKDCADFLDDDISDDVQCTKLMLEYSLSLQTCAAETNQTVAALRSVEFLNAQSDVDVVSLGSTSFCRAGLQFGVSAAVDTKGVCLLRRESSYRTDAVNPDRKTLSSDYGLFQINSKWWCDDGMTSNSRNGCRKNCADFLDDDISDDVQCAKQILKFRHRMRAWYGCMNYCRRESSSFLRECGL